ncbi:DUF502 domain-containing protein [Tepidamorphus sp. 3E244]|uniref:DUF502 domain-containing protein n=1 Tax=Tepidamorphus sp. 3E244 TaxID=3385498 RepID=UPI0038FC969A
MISKVPPDKGSDTPHTETTLTEALQLDQLSAPPPRKGGFGMRLRNYFLTGLVIAAPISITVYLTWAFVSWVDTWIKPLIPRQYNPDNYLPFTIPGVGLVLAIIFITLLGALTANLFGRTVLRFGENMLDQMPLVRSLYKALKQIFETVLSQSQGSFEKVGLVEFPRRGSWVIVFISTATRGEVLHRVGEGEPMWSLFMPTVPNPTSGFLMFVPQKDVVILDMSVEEAAKLAISAGLVIPPFKDSQEAKAYVEEQVAQKKRTEPV